MDNSPNETQNFIGDFIVQNVKSENVVPKIIRALVREVNKHKLDHGTLRYIYRQVRERCELTIPQKPRKLNRLPPKEDIDKFFLQIENAAHRLIFDFLISTGVRVHELCKIEVRHINFQNQTVFVTGKGQKDRIIVLTPRLTEKIKLLLISRNNRFLFESNRDTKFSTRRIQQLCEKYRSLAAIESNITVHSFRHIYFSRLTDASIPREHRALLGGHLDPRSQDTYSHGSVTAIRDKVIEALEKFGL